MINEFSSYVELMAAINFAPSVYTPIITSFCSIHEMKLKSGFGRANKKLLVRLDKAMEIVQRIEARYLSDSNRQNSVLNGVILDFQSGLSRIEIKQQKTIDSYHQYLFSHSNHMALSFFLSGVFCVAILVFGPLSSSKAISQISILNASIALGVISLAFLPLHVSLLRIKYKFWQSYNIFLWVVVIHVVLFSISIYLCNRYSVLIEMVCNQRLMKAMQLALLLLYPTISYFLFTFKFQLIMRTNIKEFEKYANEQISRLESFDLE